MSPPQCNGAKDCRDPFHVLCARNAGLLMERVTDPILASKMKQAEQQGRSGPKVSMDCSNFNNRGEIFKCYCSRHRDGALSKVAAKRAHREVRKLGSPFLSPTHKAGTAGHGGAARAGGGGGSGSAAKAKRGLLQRQPYEPPQVAEGAFRLRPVIHTARLADCPRCSALWGCS